MGYSPAIRDVFGARLTGAPLFSFWTHFPQADLDAEQLAEATLRFQQAFDPDFVKTAPNGMYAVEDLGVTIDFSAVPTGGVARIVETPYQTPQDWGRLPDIDITQGALARELSSLRLLRQSLPDTPIVFTAFSPMTIAAKLTRGLVHAQIAERAEPAAIHAALAKIAEGVRRHAEAAIEAGADGIFFAHQDTGRHLLAYDDFCEFVVPYDIEALVGARAGRFNILHIHGDQIRFQGVQDYPVHALNWHNWETRPSVAAGMLASGKCIVGGIDRWSITENDVPAAREQVTSALQAVEGMGDLILAPSCTIRAGFEPATIRAVRDFIRSLPASREATGEAPG